MSSNTPFERTRQDAIHPEGGLPSSMRAEILAPLDELHSLSQQLFLALAPARSKPPPPPALEQFLAVDMQLAEALKKARVHQRNQQKIDALQAEVLSLEAKLREVWAELERGRRELDETINEGDIRLKAIEKANEVALPYPELLQYAQSISAFSSAPPNMPDMSLPGMPPPPLFFPPFPNEEKMRRGHLNAEAPLGTLGELHPVGQAPNASPGKTKDDHVPTAVNPYRPDQHHHHPRQAIFDLDLDLNPDF